MAVQVVPVYPTSEGVVADHKLQAANLTLVDVTAFPFPPMIMVALEEYFVAI